MSSGEKRQIVGKVHAFSIAMTDSRSVTTMRVLGKANANPTLGTNQNQSFSFLRPRPGPSSRRFAAPCSRRARHPRLTRRPRRCLVRLNPSFLL